MIGSDILLKTLEQKGVKEIFSYPGGAVLPIFDRMPNYDIRRILVRHEQAAAFAAAGFARATNEVGVCLATSGPGATNLVTGIADAKLDSIPMVVITGNVMKHLIGSDAFQEVDMVGICEPIVKQAYFVESIEDLAQTLHEAFYLAKSGRPGPVLVDIPKCVQAAEVSNFLWNNIFESPIEVDLPGQKPADFIDTSSIEAAADLIMQAKKPIVIYGHGVILSGAEKCLSDFLEKTGMPSTWTLHGIGAADGTTDLSLGMLGMHGTGAANFSVSKADLIIGIGIRFDDRITGVLADFQLNKKIIHIDVDPSEINKNVMVNVPLCGDASQILPLLTQAVDEKVSENFINWTNLVLEKKAKWVLHGEKKGKLTEISVINSLYKKIEQDDIVTVDVGQHEMWSAQRFFTSKSRKFLASGGLGTMGFSLPTAMGAAFSGNRVWSISGDGGIQMNIQELATLMQDKIPVKIIILNNGFLGMVRQWQELFYDKNYVDTPLFNPDFKALGEAYGIKSLRAGTSAEMESALDEMNAYNEGPILCEFVLEKEENVFPMVPVGKTLGETLLSANESIDKA